MIQIVESSWGWTGIIPQEIVGENSFGNLLILDKNGSYWRLCPEDLYCEIVAANAKDFQHLVADQEFELDWNMEKLVLAAASRLGRLPPGKKYCLKIPGVLGGSYEGDNLAMISQEGLIRASGSLAEQIKDLPDGSQVKLKIVD